MQFAKDSFYVALRERLASLNPARTIERNGLKRPAILVAENELPSAAPRFADAFYIEFGEATPVKTECEQPLMSMQCFVWYQTQGDCESSVDRGRKLGRLDFELLAMCYPPYAKKRDFMHIPSVDLGTGIFWSLPVLEAPKEKERIDGGARQIERWARLMLYFYPEVKPQ
jgi:hypothetical protein